jgi:hypothetical protein
MFVHIGGMGDTGELATAVGKMFAKIKETSGGKGETPKASIDPAKSTLDAKKIDAILGKSGDLKDAALDKTAQTKAPGP